MMIVRAIFISRKIILIAPGHIERVQNGLCFAVYGAAFAVQTPPLSITLPFTGSEEQAP
jgi:hypothetical protein